MITPQTLQFSSIFFTALMLCILVYISIVLIIKNRRDKERTKWLVKTNSLITKTIFFEEEDAPTFYLPINSGLKRSLKNSRFRQTLINELITIKKDLAGVAGENLVSLYKQLNLVKDSVKKLNNSKWHQKAKAIQELSIMQQEEYYPLLYSLTNDKNEYIRMEAQTSIVKVHGFEGLRFLNDITYPISEWHQINLLMELSTVPASEFTGIENWLTSSNDTVIIFALKLSASYHQFQLYDKIVECLNHSNPKVRLQCIRCLKEIYEDTTAFHLMKIYNNEPKNHQLEILIALREIASPESISFLERQLSSDDNQIKLAASKALFNCGEEGLETIEKHPAVLQYPLNEIIQQIKMEQAR